MDTKKLLFALLRSEICGAEPPEGIGAALENGGLERLYALSKSHDVAQIIASALQRCEGVQEELLAKLQKQQMLAVYRCETLKHELASISSVLEEEKIRYVPLKGSILRSYYPKDWMRTSCDIDVLIPEEDLDRAVLALCEKLDYRWDGKKNYHDVSLFSQSGVHLELHFNICEGMENIDAMLSRVWEFVLPDGDEEYRCRQTAEFFVFHHLAHMSYHFIRGGCGIKPFVDLEIIESKLEYDRETVRSWCRSSGIEAFYDGALELTRAWLAGETHTERSELMEEYILKGGVYGTLENMVSKQRVQQGGHKSYVLSRIFMPYDLLRTVYPVLEKHRWLMPLMQVRRWFRILFRGGLKRGAREWNASQSVTDEQEKKMKALMEQLGL